MTASYFPLQEPTKKTRQQEKADSLKRKKEEERSMLKWLAGFNGEITGGSDACWRGRVMREYEGEGALFY